MNNDCGSCENVGEFFCPLHGVQTKVTLDEVRTLIKEATDPLVARIAELERKRLADVPLRHVVERQMMLQGFGTNGPALNVLCDALHANLFEEHRDTIPAPVGDSHSGAVVVPRGSSNPPGNLTLVEVRSGKPGVAGVALADSIVAIPGACPACRMLSCVCAVLMYPTVPTDGSNGEGGL